MYIDQDSAAMLCYYVGIDSSYIRNAIPILILINCTRILAIQEEGESLIAGGEQFIKSYFLNEESQLLSRYSPLYGNSNCAYQ